MKKTKIICSIGPASNSVDVMSKMVLNGMNVARINFSHATINERESVKSTVEEVRKLTDKTIAIMYDTKGPEFRCGNHENDSITLENGKNIKIVKENVLGNNERFSVNYPNVIDDLEVGSIVLLENGLMKLIVTEKTNEYVNCEIVNGGILGNKKSMSAPGIKLNIPFISEIDKEDILYAAKEEGDFLALSFVSSKEDIIDVKNLLKEHDLEGIQLIAKIESQTGIDNLSEILDEADGIMVARGDLGVEIPMERLPIEQKNMIKMCRAKGKIAIVATEMLESMKKNPRPTRAEITDVFGAVLDGTDAVMLSGETTTGSYPVETVKIMADICKTAEDSSNLENNYVDSSNKVRSAICASAVEAAKILDAKLIVTASMKGTSPRAISNLKPNCLVLATVPNQKVANKLALNYAVYPTIVNEYNTTDEVVDDAILNAKNFIKLNTKDIIVITGGFPNNVENKSTNFMKIEYID